MTGSPPDPLVVPVRRYRYSRWRWRALVLAVDLLGGLAMRGWRLFRPARPVEEPRRILLVQLDHLGDAVLTSPLLPRLRAAFPCARIDVLASPSNEAIFRADPHVDVVRVASRNWFERRPGGWALLSALWGLARPLRGDRYDWGIDVRGDVVTLFLLALAGIPRRIGWSMGGGGFLLTDAARWIPGRHEVRSRLALLEAVGLPTEGPVRVETYPTDRDRARITRLVRNSWANSLRAHESRKAAWIRDREGRGVTTAPRRRDARPQARTMEERGPGLLAVHIGAGTAAKRWPVRHWTRLLGRFLEDGWRVVVVGGPDESAVLHEVADHPGFLDCTGRLAATETAALLEHADLFIGADSGPAHLAACADVPSIVLFSGTNRPGQWRPWSRKALVLRGRVPCSPCHQKACPLANHPCMTGIRPERVHRAALRLLERIAATEGRVARP